MTDKCPKCGAEQPWETSNLYQCGSEQRGLRLFESPACIQRQRDQLHDSLVNMVAMVENDYDESVVRKARKILEQTK